MQERRTRPRQVIEFGGLVQKAGLVKLVNDDRAELLGALFEIAGWLQEDERQEETTNLKAHWRRRGRRASDTDAAAPGTGNEGRSEKDAPP